MGLDISFRLKPALDAGMETKTIVESGFRDNDGDMNYPEEILHCVLIPETQSWRDADMYIGKLSGVAKCMVRANRWGSLHEPLTKFLKANDIDWIES